MSNLGNLGIPNAQLPIGTAPDGKGGVVPVRLDSIWQRFLTRLSQLNAEKPIVAVGVSASPMLYTADTIGTLILRGGTFTTLLLTRGGTSVSLLQGTGSMFIPMTAGDQVSITYTVAPVSVYFVPGARA